MNPETHVTTKCVGDVMLTEIRGDLHGAQIPETPGHEQTPGIDPAMKRERAKECWGATPEPIGPRVCAPVRN